VVGNLTHQSPKSIIFFKIMITGADGIKKFPLSIGIPNLGV